MLINNLFEEVLVLPATDAEIDRLQIVSGFATASMASRHMEQLADLNHHVNIDLIIGMTRHSGIEKAQHLALQKLVKDKPFGMDFTCRYVVSGSPVHAKSYCWLKSGKPLIGFTGSANYTMTAFGKNQVESMEITGGQEVAEFFKIVRRNTTDCLDPEIENKIVLTESRKINDEQDRDSVPLSLLTKKTGDTPARSGINWGQRENRDRNQAYIHIPAEIANSGFFPDRFEQFTVLTDDGFSFIMVRAQDSGKGLHTTQNNAILGKYLRQRLGVPSGEYVTKQHLEEYGRHNITFTKIDDETYLLDFSQHLGVGESIEKSQK